MIAKALIKSCELFSALNDGQMDKVAGSVLEKEYDAGATVFREGDNADELLVIEEGKVALQITLPTQEGQSGRRITVDVVGRSDIVGWSALVEPYKYTLTSVCLQRVKAISFSGNKLRWLLQDEPKIGYEVLKGLTRVIASRLDDTRQVLVSERQLAPGKLER